MNRDAVLAVDRLSFDYRSGNEVIPALSNISFRIEKGEAVGLIGANGAGKSTLLKLLVGILAGSGGQILVDGQLLAEDNLQTVRRKLGYIFQDSDNQLFMGTVGEDVSFGPRAMGLPESEAAERTARALAQVGLSELASRRIYRLSGGEKKLAAIAGILAMEPELMLFDEPTVALDPVNRERLRDTINSLPGAKLIATHDLDFLLDTCSRVILLHEGEMAADGATEAILRNRVLLEANGLRLPLSLMQFKE